MSPAPTNERLLTEAIRLFSERGYDSTSVAQIESAAGLSPGSGALYHHFKSKDALLDAAIDRQLDRRNAMRDVRAIFAGLGDLRIELTMMGRYVLAVLDDERQMMQIIARTPSDRSDRLSTSYAALMDGLIAEMADWIAAWAPSMDDQQLKTVAAVAVNALVGHRTAVTYFRASHAALSDQDYIAEWTAQLANRIEQ